MNCELKIIRKRGENPRNIYVLFNQVHHGRDCAKSTLAARCNEDIQIEQLKIMIK